MFNLITPCANCPFRKDKLEQQGWLGERRAQEIFDNLKQGGFFPCHKTTHTKNDDWDDEEERQFEIKDHHQFCAGALIMLENTKIAPTLQPFQVLERLGFYKPDKLRIEESEVFDSEVAFTEWHKH